jgi:hypothetical protein
MVNPNYVSVPKFFARRTIISPIFMVGQWEKYLILADICSKIDLQSIFP